MTKKIIITSIILALILAVGFGIYYALSLRLQAFRISRITKLEKSKNEIVTADEKKEIIKQVSNFLKKSVAGIEKFSESYDTKHPETYINITVINYSDKDYIMETGYEGGEWTRDFKEEAKIFSKLKEGYYRKNNDVKSLIYPLGYTYRPILVKRIGESKFVVYDIFFPPSGTISRNYITFLKNRKIEFSLFFAAHEPKYINQDDDCEIEKLYTKTAKDIIKEFEDLIFKFELTRFK